MQTKFQYSSEDQLGIAFECADRLDTLCNKLHSGEITADEYAASVSYIADQLTQVEWK